MSDTHTSFKKVVVNSLLDEFGGQSITHDSVLVVKTSTMENGSILNEDGTEATKAEAATAFYIIDAANLDVVNEGKALLVSAVKKDAQVLKSSLKFSDGAYTNESLTALESKNIQLI
ncbi:hypothetical protein B5G52_04165 [Pseudoalteromonas sp. A601]|uniref:hypothetical protein n=1 Tax=Pseudoalteromonas sp. A601 TaxID=1967839 RepID=UPI000B3BF1E6|nr:hypothetical protein [Pseudoalteromonas sp. A601]OUS73448.1 hypothetical protein B5G52_04165 [Pseudoalteromonas sp. A601]